MEKFLTPNVQRVAENKIDTIIQKFNSKISKDDFDEIIHSGRCSLNTILDSVPLLNDAEVDFITKKAEKEGYIFSHHDDEHDSITYTFKLKLK